MSIGKVLAVSVTQRLKLSRFRPVIRDPGERTCDARQHQHRHTVSVLFLDRAPWILLFPGPMWNPPPWREKGRYRQVRGQAEHEKHRE